MTDKKETPQEIDLIELFTNIFNWLGKQIQWAYKIGLHIFYFGVRNSPWFALSIILGAAVGYFQVKTTEPYYKSELVAFSHTIDNVEIIKSINNWDYSKAFGEDTLESIKKIGATYVLDINKDGIWDVVEDIETVETHDSVTVKQRQYGNFCVQIEFSDTLGFEYIPAIKEKVLNYVTNNKRVKERNYIRLKQQQELIPRLQKEMAELDSLKRTEYFGKQKDKTVKFGEVLLVGEKETKLYHNEVLNLYKQQQSLEKALLLYKDPIELVLDFSVPVLAKDKKTERMVNQYTKLGFLLGLLIITIIDRRKFVFAQIRRSKEENIDKN
ncbi:MAG: hypothetical protein PF517_20465 [Salinivirgaceae bacterium]|jgi:hypothetical protein|nr:hypothetical protein [Salinivirgaceae bacterium]